MLSVGLQVHCGMEEVNQNKRRFPETTQWCHRRGELLDRKVWAPNEEECTRSSLGRAWHIPQVEVSSWKVGDRHENWQGDNPGSAEGSIDSLCLFAGHLQAVGTPLTVHGLWLSSGWVKTYGESLFVLQKAHGSLRSLLCFFWTRLQEGHSYQATVPTWPSLLLATVATLFWDWMSFPPKDGSELSETLPTYGRTLEGLR